MTELVDADLFAFQSAEQRLLPDLACALAVGVRGRGLLLGLELARPRAAEVEAACRDRRLIVNVVAPDVVRLAPPLVVERAEVDLALAGLTEAIAEVEAGP